MIKYLVQDIETVPETEIQDMWIEERQALEAQGKKQDFPPIWAHKVICIGLLALDEKLCPVNGGCAAGGVSGGKSEREMIQRWSDVASGRHHEQAESLRMVDWNGAKFDVPVLQTRAFRYGVPLTWMFDLQPDNRGGVSQWSKEYRDKYGGKHDDVSEIWTNRGTFIKPHLANLAKLMGLPGKVGIDGSKIHDTWKEYNHALQLANGKQPGSSTPEQLQTGRTKAVEIAAKIDTYCMEDVIQTAFVFQRFRYLSGKLTLEEYRTAATELLDWTAARKEHGEFMAKVDRNNLLLVSPVVS